MNMPQVLGRQTRRISQAAVDKAADDLLRRGERPTIERVRLELGGGSPNTVNPLLDSWWSRIGARIESGPAALHRVPETIAHVLETLWIRAMDEARMRARKEHDQEATGTAREQTRQEVRLHVLTLREKEFEKQLASRDERISALEKHLRDQMTLIKRLHAARDHLEQKLAAVERVTHSRKARAPTPSLAGCKRVGAVKPVKPIKRRKKVKQPLRVTRERRTRRR